ncbi:unnamed protein product [Acanthoscelides obtectus]|nr:unnamed protein product [Acanthoscelides obtectus]CAK1635749.1 hypothetical protein AOBTE_LOCUS9478 [Acanthoscelides obtectus]
MIDQENTDTTIINSNRVLEMKVSSFLSQNIEYKVPVKLEFELILTEDEKFKELITIPMIQTINYLETQQKVLCSIISKKDRELEEYRLEKGVISRGDLVTEPLDLNVLKTSSDKLLLNTFQQSKSFIDHICQFHEMETPVTVLLPESLQEKSIKRKRKVYRGGTVTKYTSIYGGRPETMNIKIEQQIKTEKE